MWSLIHLIFQGTLVRICPTVSILMHSYTVPKCLTILFLIYETLAGNALSTLRNHGHQLLLLQTIEVMLRVAYNRLNFYKLVCNLSIVLIDVN